MPSASMLGNMICSMSNQLAYSNARPPLMPCGSQILSTACPGTRTNRRRANDANDMMWLMPSPSVATSGLSLMRGASGAVGTPRSGCRPRHVAAARAAVSRSCVSRAARENPRENPRVFSDLFTVQSRFREARIEELIRGLIRGLIRLIYGYCL